MKGHAVINFSLLVVSLFLLSCSSDNNSLPNSDETLPTVIKVLPETPQVGQTVLVSEQISVTFSEAMDKQSVENGVIVEPNNGGTINYEPSLKTATFRPASGTSLQGDTDYTVTLQSTIKDTANNFLVGQNWTFTTEDNVPPMLVTCIPTCDGVTKDINVSPNLRINLIFDEAMFIDSFNDITVIVKDIADNQINGKSIIASGEPSKVIWVPLDLKNIKPQTDYSVTVTTGVQDNSPARNTLGVKKIFFFKTGDVPKDKLSPIVKSSIPVDGTKSVSHGSTVSVTFVNSDGSPEVMDFTSITVSNFSVTNESGDLITGTFSNNSTDTVVFTPDAALNLLDTYKVTLKNTIVDVENNVLETTNSLNNEIVATTFHTADGTLGKVPTQLGIGLGTGNDSLPIHLSTKKDGTVYAFWEKYNPNLTDKVIMSRVYEPAKNGWNSTPTDITSKIVTPTFFGLYSLSSIVTDSNDNHMLIWRDSIDKTANNYSSLLVSKWTKGVGTTGAWTLPKYIHQGGAGEALSSSASSLSSTLTFTPFGTATDRDPNVGTVHRSLNGTIAVAWMERNETDLYYDDIYISMKQLKSNDGTFGAVWSPKVRVVYDFYPGSIFKTNPALVSDSVGNIFVMYGERNLDSLFVAKYPFPSTIDSYLLSSYQSKYFTASSGDNILFSWFDGAGLPTISNYNVTLDAQPNSGVALSGSSFNLYAKDQPFGSALFPNGEGIAVIFGSLDIVYAKYDPSIGSWVEQFLEVKGAIRSFKFYQGARNNITVAWADDSKLYVKRFKQGKNFGWQPTQSINVLDARRINITDGLDGRVMIVWESFLDDSRNQPRKSDLFAIRLE